MIVAVVVVGFAHVIFFFIGCFGFARRGFARRSRPGCGGLYRSWCGGGAVGVVVGLPILRCLWRE